MKIGEMHGFGFYDSQKAISSNIKFEDRVIEYYEIEFLLSGTGKISLDGEMCSITPNMLMIARPGQHKYCTFHYKAYYLHIDIHNNFEFKNVLDNSPNFLFFTDSDFYKNFFIDFISYILENNDETDNLEFNSRFLNLLMHIKSDYSRNIKTIRHQSLNQLKTTNLATLVKYLNQNYNESISLKDMAKITNYSPNHLQKLFTEFIGMSPYRFLLKIRLKHAKELLIKSDKSISFIANSCGFESQTYFTKIFKQETYVTPLVYRKKSKGKK